MIKFDILVSIAGNLELVCDVYNQELDKAIKCVKSEIGKCKYVGFKKYGIENGSWVEVA
jgi:hypothetical protein